MNTLGERIKSVRKNNKLTQNEFGTKLGVTQTHISKIEKDAEKPSETLLRFICHMYCVNYEWLVSGDESKSNDSQETILIERFDKAKFALEDNLKYWTSDVNYHYINTISDLTQILTLFKPDKNSDLDYNAQIEYYKIINTIMDKLAILVVNSDSNTSNKMSKSEIYEVLIQNQKLIDNINDYLKQLSRLIFKIYKVDAE